LQTQQGRDGLHLARRYYSTAPAGGGQAFLIPPATAQPMRSHHTLNSQVIPVDF